MLLRVQYPDSAYDYVDSMALGDLIASRGIQRFLRPSENVWVDVDAGPTREKTAGMFARYPGPERRRHLLQAS